MGGTCTVWLVSPFFDRCVGCLVDAAAPRTSREPVFFSDVPLEDEVLKGYVIGPSGRVLGGRLIPMGCGNSLPWKVTQKLRCWPLTKNHFFYLG